MEIRKRLSLIVLTLCMVLAVSTPVLPRGAVRSVEGGVVKVSDGDTIHVETANGIKLKVRLAGVDCPETEKINHKTGKVNKPGQPFGEEARGFVEKMVLGKIVRVDIYGIDQYKRALAFVFVEGENLNVELIKAGLAEVYRGGEYGPYKKELLEAEMDAQTNKQGMWTLGDKYESPKEFRKRLRISGG